MSEQTWLNAGLLWPEGFTEALGSAHAHSSAQERSLALRPAACPCFLNAVRPPGSVFVFVF